MLSFTMQNCHIEAVQRLDSICYPFMPLDMDSVGAMINDINTSGYVVFDDQKLVAYVLYDTYNKEISILRLGVHPEYRRRGMGWRLVNRLKSRLHMYKPKLIARVPDKCLEGHLFLEKQGFVASRVIRTDGGDSYEFIFRKEWLERNDDELPMTTQIDTTEVDL